MLRPGNAGSNTAADHIEIIRRALDQAGLGPRPGRKMLACIDGAGGTKETLELLARRRASYSVGFTRACSMVCVSPSVGRTDTDDCY